MNKVGMDFKKKIIYGMTQFDKLSINPTHIIIPSGIVSFLGGVEKAKKIIKKITGEEASLMPTGTKVDRCYQKLKRKKGKSSAAAICQHSTGQSLKTGKKAKKKK